MKSLIAALAAVVALFASNAFAEDYTEYVQQCINDFAKEGNDYNMTVVYCECMDDFIAEGETQSIAEWSESHPVEDRACTTKAGWE